MSNRRRLKLMNEVLPSPTNAGASSPRARTLLHMQRLLSATAFAVACSKQTAPEPPGYGVVDPMPTPARDRDEPDASAPIPVPISDPKVDGGTAQFAEPPPSASQSAKPPKGKPPKQPEPPGYGVVDPMPPPAKRNRSEP
ncbi:MAG TPA: hypothetical protein VFQ35_16560 [Polyangiaceae bacterium]|nr:hypothetical protein [Polyangiaceae bacterium]